MSKGGRPKAPLILTDNERQKLETRLYFPRLSPLEPLSCGE